MKEDYLFGMVFNLDGLLESRNYRRSDPVQCRQVPSREAICSKLLNKVKQYEGRTSRELALLACIDNEQSHKRLSDLKNLGLVEQRETKVCPISGKKAGCWYLT